MSAPVAQQGERFSPDDMALRGRIGAYVTHSKHDSKAITANARTAFLGRFEREVDPDGLLPEAERERRAGFACKAYFARLARSSAKARARKASPTRLHEATAPRASGGVARAVKADDAA